MQFVSSGIQYKLRKQESDAKPQTDFVDQLFPVFGQVVTDYMSVTTGGEIR
jgi:hypothetical protein